MIRFSGNTEKHRSVQRTNEAESGGGSCDLFIIQEDGCSKQVCLNLGDGGEREDGRMGGCRSGRG